MDLFYFRSRLRKSWLSWILSILTICWRIRNVLPDNQSMTVESGLSNAAVVPRTSAQYSQPSDSHETSTIPPPPRLDQVKLQKVESMFLDFLGLKKRPQRSSHDKLHIPAVMLELYNQQMRRHIPQDVTAESIQAETKARKKKKVTGPVWNTVRHFPHAEDVEEHAARRLDWSEEGHKEFLWFNTTNIPLDDEIKVAELRLFVDSAWASSLPDTAVDTDVTQSTSDALRQHKRLLLRVHEILDVTDSDVITRPLDSRLVDVTKRSKTIILDILPAVQRWQLSPSDNHGLHIEILTPDGRPLLHEILSENSIDIVNPLRVRRMRRSVTDNQTSSSINQMSSSVTNQDTNSIKRNYNSVSQSDTQLPTKRWLAPRDKQPHALVYSDDAKAIKARNDKSRRVPVRGVRRKNTCKRQQMTIVFDEVGWGDWIVQPYQYDAYYCAGECQFPFADHINGSNHATIQSLVHNANFQIVPKPCCVPTNLSPISLLYNDGNGTVILKNYDDMVVEGCGCR